MPTILRRSGFEFYFYANDHLPRHIHVKKDDDFAKIDLEQEDVVFSTFKRSDRIKIVRLLRIHRHTFLEAWDEHFGQR